MVEEDLGEATIVYEDPEDGTTERTVDNEHVAYLQDHWILLVGEDDQGRDRIRRIPAQRVHYVERTVEAFEREVQTVTDRVEAIASTIGTKLPIGGEPTQTESPEPHRIDIEHEQTPE